jgi:hypothetical protein
MVNIGRHPLGHEEAAEQPDRLKIGFDGPRRFVLGQQMPSI